MSGKPPAKQREEAAIPVPSKGGGGAGAEESKEPAAAEKAKADDKKDEMVRSRARAEPDPRPARDGTRRARGSRGARRGGGEDVCHAGTLGFALGTWGCAGERGEGTHSDDEASRAVARENPWHRLTLRPRGPAMPGHGCLCA